MKRRQTGILQAARQTTRRGACIALQPYDWQTAALHFSQASSYTSLRLLFPMFSMIYPSYLLVPRTSTGKYSINLKFNTTYRSSRISAQMYSAIGIFTQTATECYPSCEVMVHIPSLALTGYILPKTYLHPILSKSSANSKYIQYNPNYLFISFFCILHRLVIFFLNQIFIPHEYL